jgi:hypothetical protein
MVNHLRFFNGEVFTSLTLNLSPEVMPASEECSAPKKKLRNTHKPSSLEITNESKCSHSESASRDARKKRNESDDDENGNELFFCKYSIKSSTKALGVKNNPEYRMRWQCENLYADLCSKTAESERKIQFCTAEELKKRFMHTDGEDSPKIHSRADFKMNFCRADLSLSPPPPSSCAPNEAASH